MTYVQIPPTGPLFTNNATNASYVPGAQPTGAFASAGIGLASSMTLQTLTNMFSFQIQVGNGTAMICFASFLSDQITCYADPSGIFLPTNAGVGVAVTKPASSRTITIRNRTGVSQSIGIQMLAGSILSVTAWA